MQIFLWEGNRHGYSAKLNAWGPLLFVFLSKCLFVLLSSLGIYNNMYFYFYKKNSWCAKNIHESTLLKFGSSFLLKLRVQILSNLIKYLFHYFHSGTFFQELKPRKEHQSSFHYKEIETSFLQRVSLLIIYIMECTNIGLLKTSSYNHPIPCVCNTSEQEYLNALTQ